MNRVVMAMAPLFSDAWVDGLLSTVIYAVLGAILLLATVWVVEKLTPFSVRKEIEQDQNMALAITMGAVILGMSIIFAASIAD